MKRAAGGLLITLALLALAAPWISPNDPRAQFPDRAFAPPMGIHVRDVDGWHAPFVYRQTLRDRVDRTFTTETDRRVPLRWFRDGRVVSVDADGPLLLLGADSLGRDVWSRLWHGARLSLGVALLGSAGALLVGALLGAIAGARRGWLDTVLTALADFIVVLPAVYLVFVLRAALPLTLEPRAVFVLLGALFVIAGWPHVARGVRAIVAAERTRDYIEAARASGAGFPRLLAHLIPASYGFLRTEFVLLVPAFLVAESTISFLGLGFPEPLPSWGLMLRDASSVSAMQTAPWTLAPALALFAVVLLLQRIARQPVGP